MKKIKRRTFISDSLMAAAALSLPISFEAKESSQVFKSAVMPGSSTDIIDTNVNLFEWPFRHLKYGQTSALVSKLRRHRITQAWAGSFEALFHKDINAVNARLAEECQTKGEGMLLPFGTVNLAWPDWKEDLRRCHEVYKMPGIRLYPIYQTFDLTHPDFPELVRLATDRGLVIQIVGDMVDSRQHHPIVQVRDLNMEPLLNIMKQVPQAKVQLLYWNHRVRSSLLEKLVSDTNVVLDTSRIEGVGALSRLIEGNPWQGSAKPVPVQHLLFGSHAPYFPVEASVIKLFESPLDLEQMKAIMSINADRFLKPVHS